MKTYFTNKRFLLRIFSSIKLFVFIFFLGSSVFASSSVFSENEVTEKKDISVFVSKLGERLQGVFREILALSTDQQFFEQTSGSQLEEPKTFFDIENHLYESEILKLADLGVIDINREKFYPDNYLRRYELIIMLVKYRLVETNKQFSPVVFPLRGRFFDVAQNTSYAPYVAYAEQKGWLNKLIVTKEDKKLFLPNKFLSKNEVCDLLGLDLSHNFCNDDNIKRGEFVAVLYRGFRESNQVLEETKELIPAKRNNASSEYLVSQVKALFSLASSQ